MKNSSTRSVILCPFNSRQADPAEQARLPEICAPLMEEKDIMIRFGIKVREIDRAYEKYNNQDFDNGVYHKFAYKNNNGTSPTSGKEGANGDDKNKNQQRCDETAEGGRNKPESTRQIIMARMIKDDHKIPERVMTPESHKYSSINMEVVEKVAKFGFPPKVTINCLRQNLCNHCTTTYYLIQMDQKF